MSFLKKILQVDDEKELINLFNLYGYSYITLSDNLLYYVKKYRNNSLEDKNKLRKKLNIYKNYINNKEKKWTRKYLILI